MIEQLNYTLLSNNEENQLVKTAEDYKIFKQKFPDYEDTYLVLVGVLPDGNIVFIKAPISSLEFNANITYKFLFIVFLINCIIVIFIVRAIIGRFTMPLFKLINITKRISNFDF
ncbi:hypothetical protein CIY_17630 [Butyrivibrio fibrisolvens 16/4]|nr:hypothetical protein CIY_17630 [Butyrivibrio fibrisolvens 16/4]